MEKLKVIIVGGVAGGASAAARLRRLNEDAEITIYEKSGYVSYANCGLPYFVGGVIKDKRELTLQTPLSFQRRFNIKVEVNHEVVSIDRKSKTVAVKDLETGKTFIDSYDKLVLSPGAKPIVPNIIGKDHRAVFTLRNVEDTYRIKEYIDTHDIGRALVAGGGYIGVEMAENLARLGIKVTLVQKDPHLINPLDADMAALVHREMRGNGVELLLGEGVEQILDRGSKAGVVTSGGHRAEADIVILSLGVRPENKLALESGLALGPRGGISVDEHMLTSDPDIYAVGDAVEIKRLPGGVKALVSLAGPANKEGRIAADNIAGIPSAYRGSAASSVLKVFSLTVAMTGLSEDAALKSGIRASSVILFSNDHASYYPGARGLALKVVFDEDSGKLLGASCIGGSGADKRIDVLATALLNGMKARDLKDLDLAYAPPYSSAKDPVNMAGFMVENVENGLLRQFGYDELANLPKDGSVILLDARTPREYSYGHVEGFVNIPVDELRENIDRLPQGKDVYVMCQSGLRSYIACRILEGHGFKAFNFKGGYMHYAYLHEDRLLSGETYPCGEPKRP